MIDFRNFDFGSFNLKGKGIFGVLIGTVIMGSIWLINNIRQGQFKKKQIDIVSLLNQEIGYHRCELDKLKLQLPDYKRKSIFKKNENEPQLKELSEKIREKENKIKEIEKQISKIRSCKNKVGLKEFEGVAKSDLVVTM